MIVQRQPGQRFANAAQGLVDAWHEEANFRFECFMAALAIALGIAVGLSATEWLYMGLAIAFVLVAELANSAIERVVDLSSGGQWHELARQAKDMAAGAVLLAALHAVGVGLYLFTITRSLTDSLAALSQFVTGQPVLATALFALPALVAVAGLQTHLKRRRLP